MINGTGWQGQAADIARGAAERAEAFYMIHARDKRLQAAEDGLQQIDQLQDGAAYPLRPAVQLAKAVAATVDPDTKLLVEREALAAIAEQTALLATGTNPLVALATRLMAKVPSARDQAADAAFAALPADPWTSFVGTLPHVHGESRLALSGRALPAGDAATQAAHAAKTLSGLQNDQAAVAHQLIDLLPSSDKSVALLKQFAQNDAHPESLRRGLEAVADGPASVARTVVTHGDDAHAAALGRIALAALPRDGWRTWAEALLNGKDENDAAVLRQAVGCPEACNPEAVAAATRELREAVGPAALSTALRNEVARSDASRVADHERLDAICGKLGCSDEERLDMSLGLVEAKQPLDLQTLGKLGTSLLDAEEDPKRSSELARGILRQGAVLAAGDKNGQACIGVLEGALRIHMASPEEDAKLAEAAARLLAEPAPTDLATGAARVRELVDAVEAPEDRLRILATVTPSLRQLAKTPEQAEMATFIADVAKAEPHEASTVYRALESGLDTLADPPEDLTLAAVVKDVLDNMNYWLDQEQAGRIGAQSLDRDAQRRGDHVLADCVKFMQHVDAVDVSDEKERAKTWIQAFEWLAENAVPAPASSAIGQLAAEMRHVTSSEMRDIQVGAVAARTMAEIAQRDHNTGLAAEAELLTFLADRKAENVSERLEGLYAAMDAQRTADADGTQRLGAMAAAALDAHDQSAPDRALIGVGALEIMASRSPALEPLHRWTTLRLYGDASRAEVARIAVETVRDHERITPGALAGAAKAVMEAVPAENLQLLEPLFLGDIERCAKDLGDVSYVPELMKAHREALAQAPDADARAERLGACLDELSRFQGEAFDQAVSASRLQQPDEGAGHIEAKQGEVVIGGVHVPVHDAT